MPTQIAEQFRNSLQSVQEALLSLPVELADTPWRSGGWTRKQILGHLLDSAANNRQRFVRASTGGSFTGPGYVQDAWVRAHGYEDQSWETLLQWWQVEHEILIAIVERIAEESLDAICIVGDGAPVTLRYLIEDYPVHQQIHVEQLTAPVA